MFNELLNEVEGADVFMIFSLILFLVFFILAIFHVFSFGRDHITKMKNIPFDNAAGIAEKGENHVS